MVHAGQVYDVMAVQNNFARQLLHVFLDLVMLDHDNDEIHSREKTI